LGPTDVLTTGLENGFDAGVTAGTEFGDAVCSDSVGKALDKPEGEELGTKVRRFTTGACVGEILGVHTAKVP
jgi:hypothetical protein